MPGNSFSDTTLANGALSDAELVEEIRAGNRKLLNELYGRYANKIYYKCLSIAKEKNLAQDLSHDVFIKICINLDKFKGASDLSFWIYAITYNHCISYLRREKRIRFDAIDGHRDPADLGQSDLLDKIMHDLKLIQLKKFIKKLKPDEEVILLMRYQEGMSIKQISSILQLGESAVKMRLKRCRTRLAQTFEELQNE